MTGDQKFPMNRRNFMVGVAAAGVAAAVPTAVTAPLVEGVSYRPFVGEIGYRVVSLSRAHANIIMAIFDGANWLPLDSRVGSEFHGKLLRHYAGLE